MHIFRSLCLAGVVAMLSTPAMATSYDAVADFSVASNPIGVWSYRSGTTGNGTTLDSTGSTGPSSSIPYWYSSANGYPYIGANTGAFYQSGTVEYQANALHLDGGGQGAEVRFTAPTAGTYTLDGSFFTGDSSMTSHTVSIVEDGNTSIFSQYLTNGATAAFAKTVTLGANDWLSFISGTDGGPSFAGTSLTATVSSASDVPEPTTFALLGLGLVGLASARGRRRRSGPLSPA